MPSAISLLSEEESRSPPSSGTETEMESDNSSYGRIWCNRKIWKECVGLAASHASSRWHDLTLVFAYCVRLLFMPSSQQVPAKLSQSRETSCQMAKHLRMQTVLKPIARSNWSSLPFTSWKPLNWFASQAESWKHLNWFASQAEKVRVGLCDYSSFSRK